MDDLHPLVSVVVLALPAAIVTAAHYIPWRRWFHHRLPRLLAYTIGVLAILLPATVAGLFAATTVQVIGLFWLAAVSAGTFTGLAWWVDIRHEAEHKLRDEIDRANYGVGD